MTGVCPSVTVVEVKQELQASLFDTLTELLYIFQILAHSLSFCLFWRFRGVDKQTDAHGIHALLLEKCQNVGNRFAIFIHILSTVLFVCWQ